MTPPPRVRRDCQCPRARHQHGTVAAYNADRCRCEPCTRARCRHAKRWRRLTDLKIRAGQPTGLVNGCGTQRRLQALAALGWSTTRLGAELGVRQQRISELQHGDGVRAQAALAARVAALYDRLSMTRPDGPGSSRARNAALGKGWVPPLCWDDDEIDLPDAKPHMPRDTGWVHKPCGTRAAYRRHLRRGEKPCSACVRAESERPRNDGKKAAA